MPDTVTFWAAVDAIASVIGAAAIIAILVFIYVEAARWRRFFLSEAPRWRRQPAPPPSPPPPSPPPATPAPPPVGGLELAHQELQSKDFTTAVNVILDAWRMGKPTYPSSTTGYLTNALARLDFIAELIRLGYLEKRLFLYKFSSDLYYLEQGIADLEGRQGSEVPAVRAQYPQGYELLKESSRYFGEKRQEIERRQESYGLERKPE